MELGLLAPRRIGVRDSQEGFWKSNLASRDQNCGPLFFQRALVSWSWSRRVFQFTGWNRLVDCFSRVEIKRMALRENPAVWKRLRRFPIRACFERFSLQNPPKRSSRLSGVWIVVGYS